MKFDEVHRILMEGLKIVAPALLLPSGKIVKGVPGDLHYHLYMNLARRIAAVNNVPLAKAEKKVEKLLGAKKIVSGFVDNEGNFQTREQAWEIAKKHDKNIAENDKELSDRGWSKEGRKLSSEHLPGARLKY